MIYLDNIGKLNFIISCFFSFDKDMTGGNIVLHRLAQKLAERDCNVYIFTNPEYPHENIKIINSNSKILDNDTQYTWEGFSFPVQKTVSIYPQTIIGNPFNTKHVSRWIIYHTRKEIEDTFGVDDYYFNFANFKTFNDVNQKPLTVFDYKLEKLYNTNNPERKGFCHITHKNHPDNSQQIFQIFKSKSLEEFKTTEKYNFDYLREQFNKHEYFLTFDKKSFFTTAAALCGCKAIILNPQETYEFYDNAYVKFRKNNEAISPYQYRLENPIQMFGVAYGLEDITWANNTINLVHRHIKLLQEEDDKTIDNFINFWQNKIYNL